MLDGRRQGDYTETTQTSMKEGADLRLTERSAKIIWVLFWGAVIPLILFGGPR